MFLPLLFITIGSICFGIFSLLRKKYQEFNGSELFPTILFMVFYSIAEAIVALAVSAMFKEITNIANVTPLTIILGAVLSFTGFVSVVLCIIGAGYGSTPILMMFATLGSIVISSTYDIVLGQTTIDNKYIAALIFIAIILLINILNDRKEAKKEKTSMAYKIICVVIFFTNGVGLVLYHIFAINCGSFGNFNFIALYSAFELIVGVLTALFLCVFRKKQNSLSKVKEIKGKSYFLIVLYAVFICGCEALSIKTTSILPVSIQSPLSFALSLIAVTVLDCIVYKVRLKSSQIMQMACAVLVAILLSI